MYCETYNSSSQQGTGFSGVRDCGHASGSGLESDHHASAVHICLQCLQFDIRPRIMPKIAKYVRGHSWKEGQKRNERGNADNEAEEFEVIKTPFI